MNESVTIPEIAQTVPPKEPSPSVWETICRCLLVVLGIFLGLVVGVIVAAAAGWFSIC